MTQGSPWTLFSLSAADGGEHRERISGLRRVTDRQRGRRRRSPIADVSFPDRHRVVEAQTGIRDPSHQGRSPQYDFNHCRAARNPRKFLVSKVSDDDIPALTVHRACLQGSDRGGHRIDDEQRETALRRVAPTLVRDRGHTPPPFLTTARTMYGEASLEIPPTCSPAPRRRDHAISSRTARWAASIAL